ncbi:hypothetical protein ACQQ2N_03625 [Dokdonella sp. MW10]|uniref:hypothetical protein n=1 Tax=Dokdonella sp. MW10 TaxID=2992926 RepID=UPI003F7CDE6B
MKNPLAAALTCGLAGLVSVSAVSAQSSVLHENGPYVTHVGGHASGADASLLENVRFPANTSNGFAVGAPRYRLTDDFTIPASTTWTVDRLRVYAYQADGATAPFTSANLMIWYGQPGVGAFLVYDGRETNALVHAEPVAYRVSETSGFADVSRRVQAIDLAIPNVILTTPGRYFVSWQLKIGDTQAAIYTPQVTILGQVDTTNPGGTAGQHDANLGNVLSAGSWINPIRSGEPSSPHRVDLPYIIYGYANDRIFIGTFD